MDVLRKRGLRWFGHVRRRDEDHVLKRALEMDVQGRRPAGRAKKTWMGSVREDMREWNVREEDADDGEGWRALVNRRGRAIGGREADNRRGRRRREDRPTP